MILLEVQGLSMAPSLRPGDVVLVDPAAPVSGARVGDWVVYRRIGTGEALVHRVVSLRPLAVKGDRNAVPDPLTPDWRYEGKAQKRFRKGRWRKPIGGCAWAFLSRNGWFPGQKIPAWLSRTKIRGFLRP